MRFRSKKAQGFQIFAVSGVNTISFAIQATDAAKKDLLGFAVERYDPQEDERFFMYGFKVFKSVIPNPDETTTVTTFDHPVQSFVWDDFTAKPNYQYEYSFYPLRGKPKNLDRSAPAVKIEVRTEELYSAQEHDIFFNRGVASSQAYSRKFNNLKPDQLPPKKAQEALQWLSRDLDDALLKFIDHARPNDTLLGCFYEFRYAPAVEALKAALDRGVDVRLIVDGKKNEFTDKEGFHPSFPREDNLALIRATKIPKSAYKLREARTSAIAHNKFMVLLKGKQQRPSEVWTGSLNLSTGGVHGQTNVGHWVRNADTAAAFQAYWELLHKDPGGKDGDDGAEVRRKNKELRESVAALTDVPTAVDDVPVGITPVFSPRAGLDVLKMYVQMADTAESAAYVTLAFGINELFKDQLKDNTPKSPITFLLLEQRDVPNPKSKDPFVSLNSKQNVYQAWGSYLKNPVYQWARETNARILEFNSHVSYVHSKFLLMDPLSKDPIVVTGSANFSNASTNENDENMLIIRGNQRVADIYLTEFNRIFNHYYFRSVFQATGGGKANQAGSLFLAEKPADWLAKYHPGSLRTKRVELFAAMEGVTK